MEWQHTAAVTLPGAVRRAGRALSSPPRGLGCPGTGAQHCGTAPSHSHDSGTPKCHLESTPRAYTHPLVCYTFGGKIEIYPTLCGCVSEVNWFNTLNPVHIYSRLKRPEPRVLNFISRVLTSLPKQTNTGNIRDFSCLF